MNAEVYIDVMRDVVRPWMDEVAGGPPTSFSKMVPLPTMLS